jgi:cell division protein FtsZ
MGGGTGTGGAPVIAKAAREAGILTVGVVTKPFQFEGHKRIRAAELGIEKMHQCVDTLLVIPNQNLFRLANEDTTFADAFAMADDVLYSGVRTFTDLMIKHGLINLDFADICAVMRQMMGKAMMGTGQATGERRAIEAAEQAISCPLLDNDVSMRGARAVLINITGGLDMTLFEVDEAANRIREEVDANANIIFGATFDEAMSGQIRVAVVATGIDAKDMVDGAAEGSFKNTPRSVFKLGGGRNLREDLEETPEAPTPSLEPETSPEDLRKSYDKPFGHRHDLFSMDFAEGVPGESRAGYEGEDDSEYEPEESFYQPPEPPKKKAPMTFLERLGVSRRAPTPPPPPEKPIRKERPQPKPEFLDGEMDPEVSLERDPMEVPAFIRNQRRKP